MKNKCVDCGNCCRETEMILSASDIARIKNNNLKNLSRNNFVKKTEDGLFQLKNINGCCVFLNPTTNFCEIYMVRPEGCRFYPLIYDSDKKLCVLDHECPRPELFYSNKNSQLKTCEKIVRFLENEVLFTKLR
ncbi:MAG: YkgJ family cysteine cluster protein [Candidatus Lokiarchaeota archaeon]|nr:YkgJ family cysteine cluster protein [Candidatus Lokiarchaeota archaeon]